MSKRITCEELVSTGFVNKVFNAKPGEDAIFLEMVLEEVHERLGDHLNADSLIKVKKLIRAPEKKIHDAQMVDELLGGVERFVAGVPQEEFRKLASGEKKHKL